MDNEIINSNKEKSYLIPTLCCVLIWQTIPLIRFAYDNTVIITVIRICCLSGIIFFMTGSVVNFQKDKRTLPTFHMLLCFYTFLLIAALVIPIYKNGLYETVFLNIQNKFGLFSFLAPFMAFYRFVPGDLGKLKKLAIILCFFELFIIWYVFGDISPSSIEEGTLDIIDPTTDDEFVEVRKWLFLVFPGIKLQLLFCIGLFRRDMKYSFLMCVLFLLYFYMVIIGGSRGSSIICSLLLTIVILCNFYMKNKKKIRVSSMFISSGAILIVILSIFVLLLFSQSRAFEHIRSRIFVDEDYSLELQDSHRTTLVDDFFVAFNKTPYSWLIGRGIHGEYFSDTFFSQRNVIEYGFLQLILNGGVGLLIVFWGTLICGIKKGFSEYKNRDNMFVLFISILLIMRLSEQISYGIPELSVNDYTIWYFYGLLFQKTFTEKSTDEIISYINNTSVEKDDNIKKEGLA